MTFNNEIVAGNVLVREAIQSENYVAGSDGWKIAANGDAEFNNVTVRGELIAANGADYVKVSPNPVPGIDFMSGSVDVTAPARIGFNTSAGTAFEITGPNYSGYSPSSISFDEDMLHLFGNSQLILQAQGTALVRGSEVQLGGNSAASQVRINGNAGTVVYFGIDRGKGLMEYASVAASTPAAVAEQAVVTTGAIDFEVNRAYRITYHYQGQGNTAADGIGFRLRRGSLLGTSLFDSLATHEVRAVNSIVNGETSQIVFNNTGALLSTAIIGSVYRQSGAGNVLGFANAANPVWLLVEDIGLAADYPGIKAL